MENVDKSARAHVRLRLPSDLKEWIKRQADQYGGSLNAEIVRALWEHKERIENKPGNASSLF